MMHGLKTWLTYFQAVLSGAKTFEVRKDDRGFEVGDVLHLQEWDPGAQAFTGRTAWRRVTYLLRGGQFGIEPGFVVMGLGPEDGHG